MLLNRRKHERMRANAGPRSKLLGLWRMPLFRVPAFSEQSTRGISMGLDLTAHSPR